MCCEGQALLRARVQKVSACNLMLSMRHAGGMSGSERGDCHFFHADCPCISVQAYGCGSKLTRRGNPQVLVHSTSRSGKPFWNSGFLSHSHGRGFLVTLGQVEGRLLSSLQASVRAPSDWLKLCLFLNAQEGHPIESRNKKTGNTKHANTANKHKTHDSFFFAWWYWHLT